MVKLTRLVSGAPIAAWDNSTRGLDSASALEFVKALRNSSNLAGTASAVAIYQASQAIYDIFDKVTVLYDGRQIFFGPCSAAVEYFTNMGWHRPSRQTSGDFLTAVTNPQERQAREGMEDRVPRTADEFEQYWKNSSEYEALKKDISQHLEKNPPGGESEMALRKVKQAKQAKHAWSKSPYIISVPMQLRLCMVRAYQRYVLSYWVHVALLMAFRTWNDLSSTMTTFIGRIVMSLIIGSIYYG